MVFRLQDDLQNEREGVKKASTESERREISCGNKTDSSRFDTKQQMGENCSEFYKLSEWSVSWVLTSQAIQAKAYSDEHDADNEEEKLPR